MWVFERKGRIKKGGRTVRGGKKGGNQLTKKRYIFPFSRGEKKRKKKHSPNGVYKNHVKMYFERQKW